MSEYKRLTSKKSDGARVVVTENGIGYVNPEFIQRADVNLQKAIDRLAELEDLLERDVLTNPKGLTKEQILWAYEMDVGMLKNEIKRLKKELKEDE